MSLLPIFVLALALSMDALAVAMAGGCALSRIRVRLALRVGLFFGGFQALMPLIGWLAGQAVERWVSSIGFWIASALLALIGGKMLYESFKLPEQRGGYDISNVVVLLGFAVATSIDALVAGLSLSLLGYGLLLPILIIGAVTFALSFAGVMLGCRLRTALGRTMERIGGIGLILLACKSILQNLLN